MKTPLLTVFFSILTVAAIHNAHGQAQSEATTRTSVRVAPAVRYVAVDGDEQKFREDWWMEEQWAGGLESLRLRHQFAKDVSLQLDARAIAPEHDYKLRVGLFKQDVGSIRTGYTEYRKYFDGSGGFFESFTPPLFELDREMHLDIGTLSVDASLTKPQWPEVTLGYEHKFKEGDKSLLEWGSVTQSGVARKIFPAFKKVDEEIGIFKAQVRHDWGPVEIGDQFRYEDYSIKTNRVQEERNLDASSSKSVTVSEDQGYDALLNTLQFRGHVMDKVYLSLGYLFSAMDGDTRFTMDTVPFDSPFDKKWSTDAVDIERDSHVLSLNTMLGPFAGLTLYGGFQAETAQTDGDTNALLVERNFSNAVVSPEAVIDTRQDEDGFEESVGARYTGIARTTLYAEGKWSQRTIDLREREIEDGVLSFDRLTHGDRDGQRYTVGINTSPLRRTTFTARYRRIHKENDYHHHSDTEPGYSAFITDQRFTTDELTTKVSVRISNKIQGTLKYQLVATDIDTASETTPPATVFSGNYDANIYSTGVTVTPLERLYLAGLLSYRDARLRAFDNGVASIPTYEDDTYTLIGTAGYAIGSDTDIRGEYLYSRSDNFEDNSTEGLPLGTDSERHRALLTLSHQITGSMRAELRYGYYNYDEHSNSGADDYRAHLAGMRWSFDF